MGFHAWRILAFFGIRRFGCGHAETSRKSKDVTQRVQSSQRKPPDKKSLKCYSELRKRKYEDDHSAVGIVFCGRAVRIILKISWSEASSSRNAPPMCDSSCWVSACTSGAS